VDEAVAEVGRRLVVAVAELEMELANVMVVNDRVVLVEPEVTVLVTFALLVEVLNAVLLAEIVVAKVERADVVDVVDGKVALADCADSVQTLSRLGPPQYSVLSPEQSMLHCVLSPAVVEIVFAQ
jgi:hypothetical protein